MTLNVEQLGSGPDMLLVHGWGLNAGVWRPFVSHLEGNYRLTLVDLPGHGNSGWDPDKTSLDDWTDALLTVAPPQAIWLGWSLGGLLAQNAALRAPERVSVLAVVAGTPRFVQRDDWRAALPESIFRQFGDALTEDVEATLRRFLTLQVRGADHARDTLRQLSEAMSCRGAAHAAALAAGLRLLLQTDLRGSLAQLAMPVMWLLGEKDTLVPRALGDALTGILPAVTVAEVGGAAHAPFLSHPVECARILNEFLQHA